MKRLVIERDAGWQPAARHLSRLSIAWWQQLALVSSVVPARIAGSMQTLFRFLASGPIAAQQVFNNTGQNLQGHARAASQH